MRRGGVPVLAVLILAIGMVGTMVAIAADQSPAESLAGEYIGTFHPKGARCGECHAKAAVSRGENGYTLKVDVDYTPVSEKCKGATRRTIVLQGSASGSNLLFRNESYNVVVADDEISGERFGTNVAVRTVLRLKRHPKRLTPEPQPSSAPRGER
jgi:hypothetical protein